MAQSLEKGQSQVHTEGQVLLLLGTRLVATLDNTTQVAGPMNNSPGPSFAFLDDFVRRHPAQHHKNTTQTKESEGAVRRQNNKITPHPRWKLLLFLLTAYLLLLCVHHSFFFFFSTNWPVLQPISSLRRGHLERRRRRRRKKRG